MSIESIASIVFLVVLALILYKNREKLEIQKIFWPLLYFAMYKTKLGIKQMESLANKHPKTVDVLSKIGIFFGVLGMILIGWLLIKNLYALFLIPSAASGVALVLPFKVKGGFYVPFFYWIISIFVIAIIHEFSHGVVAKLHKIPVKSSGFAFLSVIVPIIPAAFVEPDEKILEKKTKMQKLSVFAAGPFSNLLSGVLVLILFFLISIPVASNVIEFNGVKVEGYTNGSSAELSGVPQNSVINQIDDLKILTVGNLSRSLEEKSIGETVNVVTTNGTYNVKLGVHPENNSLPYLGVLVSQSQKTNPEFEDKYGSFTASAILWFMGLLYWIYLLSVGIGLFNLVPIGPIDGGLMSREIFRYLFKEETALKVWKYVSTFFLVVILINLAFGFF